MSTVFVKTFAPPPFCEKEALRYARAGKDESVSDLLAGCWEGIEGKLEYKVCYTELPVCIKNDAVDFGCFDVRSKDLAKNLSTCDRVILFAATVGLELDRQIAKYGRIAPSRALMLQAIGAERIEALCDAFCAWQQTQGNALVPRFSAGYGDLSLETQRDIFRVLDCPNQIGLYLNGSLLMTPSKSVTAFAGITTAPRKVQMHKCSLCENTDCVFRSNK